VWGDNANGWHVWVWNATGLPLYERHYAASNVAYADPVIAATAAWNKNTLGDPSIFGGPANMDIQWAIGGPSNAGIQLRIASDAVPGNPNAEIDCRSADPAYGCTLRHGKAKNQPIQISIFKR
jgi:hypothetical protein